MILANDMPALAAVQSSYAFVSYAHLEQAVQRELAALAAIEAVRRSACRWLEEWSGPERVKEHLACHIEARHQTEREPHLLRLADLHQQRIAVTKSHGGRRARRLAPWSVHRGGCKSANPTNTRE